MKKIKNKKVILALVLLLGMAATFAYYTTTDSFENIFKTSKYGTKVEEVFESPDDWTPGDETSKTVIATNTGDVCENVRVSYTESWKNENNNDLPLVDPILNERIAIINFDNTADWKQNGNYYYYNKNLLKNESTTSFIKSVTYNPNYATSGMNCTSTTEGNKTTKECSTGNDSYAGATYKLTITVETIQCDAMESEWGVTIAELNGPPAPVAFATDSWESIVKAVQDNNTSLYNVGDTKEIDLGTLGTHTLRIANKSTPAECSQAGFSQTACGFVLEFANIITTHNMNPVGEYKGINYQYGWNVDGWPATSMRTYVNTDIYNAIPEVLRNGIIDTTVVSGHGSTAGETNFTSTDKLYLLSTHEVWEDVDGNTNGGFDYYDTAYNQTRQLDYYKGKNVTTSNYAEAMKQNNGTDSYWWLRSAFSANDCYFYYVYSDGNLTHYYSRYTYGVAPAFRIG